MAEPSILRASDKREKADNRSSRRVSVSEMRHSRRFGRTTATFAVGTRVTSRPPHRSVRAQFGHTAPTLGV